MEENCVGGACGMHKENEKHSKGGGPTLLRNLVSITVCMYVCIYIVYTGLKYASAGEDTT